MNQVLAGSIAGFVLGLGVGLLSQDLRSPPIDHSAPASRPATVATHIAESPPSPVVSSVASSEVAPASGSVVRKDAPAPSDVVPRAEISGRLRLRDGSPVVGGTVYAFRADLEEWASRKGRLSGLDLERFAASRFGGQAALTYADGYFTLFGLTSGKEYLLVAIGAAASIDLFASSPAYAQRVTAPAASVDVFDCSARLLVRIVPDQGVRDRIVSPDGSGITLRTQVADASGATPRKWHSRSSTGVATLDFGIRIGIDAVAELSFEGKAIEPVVLPELRIPSGVHVLEVPVNLRTLRCENRLELEVSEERGAPVASAAIAILAGFGHPDYAWTSSPQGTEAAQRKLDQGRFSEEHVQPGPTTLRIAAPVATGLAPAEIEFEMPESGAHRVRVVLARGGKLRIAAEASVMPLLAVRIVAGPPPGKRVLAPITAEGSPLSNGIERYERPVTLTSGHSVPPGEYTLLYRTNGVDCAQAFSIVAGEETKLVLR